MREALERRSFDEAATTWDLLYSLRPPAPEAEETQPGPDTAGGEEWVEERAEEQMALVRAGGAGV